MRIVDLQEISLRGPLANQHYVELYAKIEQQQPGKATVFDSKECPDPARFSKAAASFFVRKYGNGCFHRRLLPGEIAVWLTKDGTP